MKRKDIMEEVRIEILNAPPQVQAKAINKLDRDYVAEIVNFLLAEKKKDFLKHLSISALVVFTRHLFKHELDEENIVKIVRLITQLPKFPQVWKRVENDHPVEVFSLIPKRLLQKTFAAKLKNVNAPCHYSKMVERIEEGTFALKMLNNALADEEGIPGYDKDVKCYQVLMSSIGGIKEREWIVALLKVLPSSQKLNFLYGNHFSDIQVGKIFCICMAEEYYISDERSNPLPLAYAFLTFDVFMYSGEYAYQQGVEDLIKKAIAVLAEDFSKFAKKMGATNRLASVLDFFWTVTYSNEKYVVEEIPMAIIKELLSKKKCLWIMEQLSDEQKISLSKRGSVHAADAVKVLSKDDVEDKDVSPVVVSKIQKMSLEEKMQLVVRA